MKKIVVFSIAFYCVSFCWSQTIPPSIGATSMGNAQIKTMLDQDPFTAYNHHAWSPFQKKSYLLVDVKNHFFIPELNTLNLGINLHQSWGEVAIFIRQFGYQYYKEQSFTVSYAKLLSEKLALGSKLSSLHESVDETYRSSYFHSEVTLAFLADKHWQLGSALQLTNQNKRVTIGLRQGVAFQLLAFLKIRAEYELASSQQAFRFSFAYEQEHYQFSLGADHTFSSLFAGANFQFPFGQIALAFQWHATLGLSPDLSYAHEL